LKRENKTSRTFSFQGRVHRGEAEEKEERPLKKGHDKGKDRFENAIERSLFNGGEKGGKA